MDVTPVEHGVRVLAFDGARPVLVLAAGAEARPAHTWFRDFELAREAERGLDHLDDALHAVTFEAELAPGTGLTLVASAETAPALDGEAAWRRRVAHEADVLGRWRDASPERPLVRRRGTRHDDRLARPHAGHRPPRGQPARS